jgi:hypothetical protein
MIQLPSTRVLFNRLNRPEVQRQPEYDSHRFPPTGAPNRPMHLLRPTTNQGNDARLQLVPASTTAGVNGLDSKHELVALQTTGVRLAETTAHDLQE